MKLAEIARRSISLMDLTSLGAEDTPEMIVSLCDRAAQHRVAAVCVYPEFVSLCRDELSGTRIPIATVVNFPRGEDSVHSVHDQTVKAIRNGAQEIDLVLPWRAWLAGDTKYAGDMIDEVKGACESVCLKVILETGCLGTPGSIEGASNFAIDHGADFIKTSTGKSRISATPHAAEIMLSTIARSKMPVGFKAAGGIRTPRQAGYYLKLADRILGRDWTIPGNFRFGASSLLQECLPFIDPEK